MKGNKSETNECNDRRAKVDWTAVSILVISIVFGAGILYAKLDSVFSGQERIEKRYDENTAEHTEFRVEIATIKQALKDNNGILKTIAENTRKH